MTDRLCDVNTNSVNNLEDVAKVKRLLDFCKIYTHKYYTSVNDLWSDWKNYITRGRSEKISLTLPCIRYFC